MPCEVVDHAHGEHDGAEREGVQPKYLSLLPLTTHCTSLMASTPKTAEVRKPVRMTGRGSPDPSRKASGTSKMIAPSTAGMPRMNE